MPISYKDALANNIPVSQPVPELAPHAEAAEAEAALMQFGENGCAEYTDAGIGSDVMAISQLVRNGSPETLFRQILARGETREIVDAITLIFVTRNARGGKGEKDLAFKMFLELMGHAEYAATCKSLLPLFVHFGYWKDLLLLLAMELKSKGFVVKKNPKKRKFESLSDEVKASNETIAKSSFLMRLVIDLVCDQWNEDVRMLARFKEELQYIREKSGESSDEYESIKSKGPSISLLAKWLPREGSELDRRTGIVKHLAAALYPQSTSITTSSDDAWKSSGLSRYRKLLVELSSYLQLPEVLLAAKRADEISFARVASKATHKLKEAFLNMNGVEDPKRQLCKDNFLTHMVKKGLKGGQVMPHEIVGECMKNQHQMAESVACVLDAQWKDLWAGIWKAAEEAQGDEDDLEAGPHMMVPICDVSGSMNGTPMEVAIAMSIGIAERSYHPAFMNMILTFHTNPTWIAIDPDDSIAEKVRKVSEAPWSGCTDFAKAFDKLLERCIEYEIPRSQMPSLICFSDTQFDQASGHSHCYFYSPRHDSRSQETMWRTIEQKVKEAGEEIGWPEVDGTHPPPMIFWNLRNTGGHPVEKDEQGTVLLSGYSPSLLKSVVNGDVLKETEIEVVETAADGTITTRTETARVTPEEVLAKMLSDPLYDTVRQVLGDSTDGALREYECLIEPDPSAEMEASKGEPIEDGFEMI